MVLLCLLLGAASAGANQCDIYTALEYIPAEAMAKLRGKGYVVYQGTESQLANVDGPILAENVSYDMRTQFGKAYFDYTIHLALTNQKNGFTSEVFSITDAFGCYGYSRASSLRCSYQEPAQREQALKNFANQIPYCAQ
jgi:hypothetical protein